MVVLVVAEISNIFSTFIFEIARIQKLFETFIFEMCSPLFLRNINSIHYRPDDTVARYSLSPLRAEPGGGGTERPRSELRVGLCARRERGGGASREPGDRYSYIYCYVYIYI